MKTKVDRSVVFILSALTAMLILASAETSLIAGESTFSEEEQSDFFSQWADYPDMRVFTLSDGTKVSYPLRVLSASMVQIIGTSDLDKMNEYLNRHNVEAVGLFGKALVSLTAVDNRVTGIGPYQELIVGVLAKGTNSNREKVTGFFIIQQYVTSTSALSYGVELWGMPKELAQISVRTESDGSRWFDVVDINNNGLGSGIWQNSRSLFPSFQSNTGNFITPTPDQHFVSFASEYKNLKGNFYDPKYGDRINIIQSEAYPVVSFWTNLLSPDEAGFTPVYWQRGDLMSVVGSVDDVLPVKDPSPGWMGCRECE
jgi:hypothetical protein